MGKYFLTCYYFSFAIVCFWGTLHAQKPCIDTGSIKKWTSVGGYDLTNDGQFMYYTVLGEGEPKTVLQPISLRWKLVLSGTNGCQFTQDNKNAYFMRNDSVGIIGLDDEHSIHYKTGIGGFELIDEGQRNELFLYSLNTKSDEWHIADPQSGKEVVYGGVERYWHSADGKAFIFETKKTDSPVVYQLELVAAPFGEPRKIWTGPAVNTLLMDSSGQQGVFSTADSGHITIWTYNRTDTQAEKVIDDHSEGIEPGYRLADITVFNAPDKRVFFNLKKEIRDTISPTLLPVDIWSYKDSRLQSVQLKEPGEKTVYPAAVGLDNRKIVQLEYGQEQLISPLNTGKEMKYVLVQRSGDGPFIESNWNPHSLSTVYLVNLATGERRLIDTGLYLTTAEKYTLSYNEHYIYYFDVKQNGYRAYRIADGHRVNLTATVRTDWSEEFYTDWVNTAFMPKGIAYVIKHTDEALVYDRRDVFRLDPEGKLPVLNLTHARSRPGNLQIRLLYDYLKSPVIDRDQPLLFSVFDQSGKEEGIVYSRLDSIDKIRDLHLLPCRFDSYLLKKAKYSNRYLVEQMTAQAAPNIYATEDFNRYQPMSAIHPERAYNWMSSELITWKIPNGDTDRGILYKPENFDPKKRYPLLVYYYERLSDNLHHFVVPENSEGRLNIPMYVSNGYLVFVPDIHYERGWPGRSAYNAVVSGVNYLCRRPYIDRTKMGLQGHSFGGFETNYIIAHTHLFAAAMSASGMSNSISGYSEIAGDGNSRQGRYEWEQYRMGASLWQKPELYIDNSPILRADSITTPLLIMANKGDEEVPFDQGVGLFVGLRRLGKKAWLLQYDHQGHNVFDAASKDLTVRMYQFFNYYLKGCPPPRWMVQGVPAKLKGIDNGLGLDTSGAKP